MKRLIVLVLAVLAFGGPVAAQPIEKPKLTIATASLGLTYLPLVLAQQLGYFKDEGLTVEIAAFSVASKALEALLSGGDTITAAERRTRDASAKVFGGPYPEASLYSTADFVKRNPSTVQAVTNAIVHAEHWLEKATVEQLADAVPPEYLLGDKALYM